MGELRVGRAGAVELVAGKGFAADAYVDVGRGRILGNRFAVPRKSNISFRCRPISFLERKQDPLKNSTCSLLVSSPTDRREVCSLGASSASMVMVLP